MTWQAEPLSHSLPFGRLVRGLTRADLADPETRDALRRLWVEHGVILFRDGEHDDGFHLELSRVFGPLEQHPVNEIRDANPEMTRLASVPGEATLIEVDGEVGGAWVGWHSDLIYAPKINRGGMLRALQPSSRGGLTGFIDQIDAYERLSPELRRRIEGLNVIYQLGLYDDSRLYARHRVKTVRMAGYSRRILERIPGDFPPVVHPLVFVQQETGRKVLNFSVMFAVGIEGMQHAEGDALLDELGRHVFACPAYHHVWGRGEMVLWDNWRMLHSVSLVPPDETRIMMRTTIAGDYALGRFLLPGA